MHKIDSSTKSKCENQHMVPSEVPTIVFINKSNRKKAAILMHQIKEQIPYHITPDKQTHTHTHTHTYTHTHTHPPSHP